MSKDDDPVVEVTLSFRCRASELDGTEVGDRFGRGYTNGITTSGISRVVVNHRAEMGYVHWRVRREDQ